MAKRLSDYGLQERMDVLKKESHWRWEEDCLDWKREMGRCLEFQG